MKFMTITEYHENKLREEEHELMFLKMRVSDLGEEIKMTNFPLNIFIFSKSFYPIILSLSHCS